MNDQPTEARTTRTSAARVEYRCEDPLAIAAMFAHLRQALGDPDVAKVSAAISVTFDNLSGEQVGALDALMRTSWGIESVDVIGITERTRLTDGRLRIRELSAAGDPIDEKILTAI